MAEAEATPTEDMTAAAAAAADTLAVVVVVATEGTFSLVLANYLVCERVLRRSIQRQRACSISNITLPSLFIV